MSDDSFFREVNEEIRQEQARALWDRFGPAAIVVAVIAIAATAAWVGYDRWAQSRANQSGDAFSQALRLAGDGNADGALEALGSLQQDGSGAYPVLAQLRTGTLLASRGDHASAVAAFDAVAADTKVPAAIRDIARLRAAYVLIDNGSYDDVAQRAEPLAADGNPYRHSAREALGLAAWKSDRSADALALFDQVANDDTAPRNSRQRAGLMAELIRGSGTSS